VWAILVSQALAHGELAGPSPVTGLYTAFGALLLYALVGSSRYLHVGPESSVTIVTAAYLGALVADALSAPRTSPSSRRWSEPAS
jgi:sulfate permease, SulP family